jgi:O-antigen/teichoic acid export membrane protein
MQSIDIEYGRVASKAASAKPRWSRLLPVWNVSASWLSMLVSTAGGFIVTPALLGALGEVNYGIWLLVTSFIFQLRILDLGISNGTMKFTAGAYERGDSRELTSVWTTSFLLFGVAAFLTLGATNVLMVVLPSVYPASLGKHGDIILALGVSTALELLLRPYAASVRARSLFFLCDTVETVSYGLFKLGLGLYFAGTGSMSLTLLCGITVAETVFRNVVVAAAALKFAPWTRRLSPRAADRATLVKLARYGSAALIINLADVLRFQIDSAVIGGFMPGALENISIYSIGMRLVTTASFSIGIIGAVLIPRFSGLSEKGDAAGLTRLLDRTNLISGLFTGYLFINIAALGPDLLALWIDKPWVSQSSTIMLLMLPSYYVMQLHGPVASLLAGSGKLRGQTAITVAEALANVALSVALVRPFGIYGVCLGTAIPMVLVRGIAFPIVVKKELGIGVLRYYRTHLPTMAISAVYSIVIIAARFIPIHGFLSLIAAGVANTLFFAVLVLLFIPDARQLAATRR